MKLELNSVYNIDCLDGMRLMQEQGIVADCLLTDIPYGECNGRTTISYSHKHIRNVDKGDADKPTFDLKEFLQLADKVVSGVFLIFCGIEQVSEIKAFFASKKDYSIRLLVWEKTNPSPMNGESIYLSSIECCMYIKKRGGTFNGFCKSAVIRCPCGKNEIHPTMKPLPLWYELLNDNTNEGQLVLDTCSGSGTTAVACHKLKRNYICFELNKDFYESSLKRINDETAQLSIFDLI